MPSLESLHQHFRGKPFEMLAINIQEKRDTVLDAVRRNGVSFTNLLDQDGEVTALYGVGPTPVKFLINTEGNMVGAALGYRDWSRDEIKRLIQLLIDS